MASRPSSVAELLEADNLAFRKCEHDRRWDHDLDPAALATNAEGSYPGNVVADLVRLLDRHVKGFEALVVVGEEPP